jgi:hypothetical protein
MDFDTTTRGVTAMFAWFRYEGQIGETITLIKAEYEYDDEGWSILREATKDMTDGEYVLLQQERARRLRQMVRVMCMAAEKVCTPIAN